MIPKVIHYCWFGGKPLPPLAEKCIASWKKYCPDYEIIRWDESNYDVTKNEYMRQAYEAKKWSFVSDYARKDIIYQHGGIYLDTDVELIRPLDELLKDSAFLGMEAPGKVASGLIFGAEAESSIAKELRDIYKSISFVQEDGSLNLKSCPEYESRIMERHGLQQTTDIQILSGVNIYPPEYFNPKNGYSGEICLTDNTYSIHHFMASWVPPYRKLRGKVYWTIRKMFGEKTAEFARKNVKKLTGGALISIVIPVYKVEPYLRKCVDSVLAQTYTNLEVILVDDGSPDGCPDICDEYAERDPRVKVIHQTNAGVSAARNAGIDASTGAYISFVDSDDLVAPTLAEQLVAFMMDKNVIMARASYFLLKEHEYLADTTASSDVDSFESRDYIRKILSGTAEIGACATLFRKELIDGLRFNTTIRHNEDKLFLFEFVAKNQGTVVCVDSKLYGYVQRAGSCTKSGFSEHSVDLIKANKIIFDMTAEQFPQFVQIAAVNLLGARLSVVRTMIETGAFLKNRVLYRQIKEETLQSKCTAIPLKRRIELITLSIGDWAYYLCTKIYRFSQRAVRRIQ